MLQKWTIMLAIFSMISTAQAQISHGGSPSNWANKQRSTDIPFVHTAELNRTLLDAEDAVTDLYKEAPYRFGVEVDVNYTHENSGRWIIDADSNIATWQLGIHCPNAANISLVLSQFDIPKGALLFVWNKDRSAYLGGFNHSNMNEEKTLAIGLLEGDEIVIEYQVPMQVENWGQIAIGQIVHGYRPILESHFEDEANRGPYGDSGNCNINVNCPEGADWQVEKRSVALIVSGGNAICSGALVNNTAQDGTPYFLTANHCLGGSVNNWVFYFNHESSTCNGNTGPTDNSISGAILRANNAYSDFALLELNDIPPVDWNVQYAGWDHSDNENAVSGAVGIHHPSGDVKKICFEEDAPYHSAQAGAEVWFIDQWELGVTEGGSSGSPLFNQDHRIIGQLYGGWAACSGNVNNGEADYYGRFGQSWDHSATNSQQLAYWLDPSGTGQTILDGWPDGFVAAQLDAGSAGISGVETFVCGDQVIPQFRLRNFGTQNLTSCVISYQYNANPPQTINWTGSLAQYQEQMIALPVMYLVNGANTIHVEVSDPNNGSDENINNNSADFTVTASIGDTFDVTINLEFDAYAEETSWEILDGNTVIVSSDGTYSGYNNGDTVSETYCLPAGCYTFSMLDEYGDGMCFFLGCGTYEVVDENGTVLASGGEFEFEENTEICLGQVSVPQKEAVSLSIYPNPAQDFVRIQGVSNAQVTIHDITGKVVFEQKKTNDLSIPVKNWSNGIYFVQIVEGGKTQTQKLVIRK
ncbi:MAG: T9SS type A sorting domain-containing protein [Flavobacteriales bacterium]